MRGNRTCYRLKSLSLCVDLQLLAGLCAYAISGELLYPERCANADAVRGCGTAGDSLTGLLHLFFVSHVHEKQLDL